MDVNTSVDSTRMDINTVEAAVILGLMRVAALERGLDEREEALRDRMFAEMPDWARYVHESMFRDDTWENAAEENPEVKAAREQFRGRQNGISLHGERERAWEAFYDRKHLAHERILATVQEGWVF